MEDLEVQSTDVRMMSSALRSHCGLPNSEQPCFLTCLVRIPAAYHSVRSWRGRALAMARHGHPGRVEDSKTIHITNIILSRRPITS